MKEQSIIISACNGNIGSYMCEYILANTDYNIIGTFHSTNHTFNLSELYKTNRFKAHQLDITDKERLTNLIKLVKPAYFINFAGITSVVDSWKNPASYLQTNAEPLIHILEAVKDFVPDCRVFSAGSIEQNNNNSIYGMSKQVAEIICNLYKEKYNLYVVHGKLGNCESYRRSNTFVTKKITEGVIKIYHSIKKGENFEPIYLGNLESEKNWCHACDIVNGIWKMLNQTKEVKNYSVLQFLQLCLNKIDIVNSYYNNEKRQVRAFINGQYGFRTVAQVQDKFYRPYSPSNIKNVDMLAYSELGWYPEMELKDIVADMISWDLQNFKKV